MKGTARGKMGESVLSLRLREPASYHDGDAVRREKPENMEKNNWVIGLRDHLVQ
jgi:hypothetical protein